MTFYDMLASKYDEIFPFSEQTFSLMRSFTTDEAKVLDIGCSTGAYVKAFNDNGYTAQGIELNTSFNFHDDNITQMDMNNMTFEENSFDFIYSIGNTIVHAPDKPSLEKLIKNIFKLLKPKGTFFMQIVNYDRIFGQKLTSLPTIETDNIKFERNYAYEDMSAVDFNVVLTDKVSGTSSESSVKLTPLIFSEIQSLSGRMGANFVRFCGDFQGNKFIRNESFAMIAVFTKPEQKFEETAPPSSCSLL